MSKQRTVKTYLVLRQGRYPFEAIVVRKSTKRPTLKRGECAVRVELSVPEEAFEPMFQGPSLAFEVGQVLRAPVAGKTVS
jgi:hypothetical protein